MKSARAVFLVVLIFFCTLNLSAAKEYHYDFNANCQRAYEAIMELRINDGMRLLEAERRTDPSNLIPVFLENYNDFLTILLTGDAQQYKVREKNLDIRLNLLNQGPQNNPWFRYCKSSVYFQWAVLRIYFNSYFKAGVEFRNSFLLLKTNRKAFPDFKYNLILSGLEKALVGTVPGNYQWVSSLLGMKGNVRGGTAELVRFLNDNSDEATLLRNDAVFYYCYIKFFLLEDKEDVWNYLNRHYKSVSANNLMTFLEANLAINDNKADKAFELLTGRNKSTDYLSVPLFDYETGIAAFRMLDTQTPYYFKLFLKENKGKLFVKSSLQKLSLYYWINGNKSLANYYRNQILKRGNALTDADKQAQRFAESGQPFPDKRLLKAELWCDGGFYQKALTELSSLKPSQLKDDAERSAYFYRYGRVYQLMGNLKSCIPFYKEAIVFGENLPGQYAARSAYETGFIYEESGNKSNAVFYYRKCLNMNNEDFKANLDQKAKAGLNRLGAY